jgi:hypothetical protein
MPSYGGMSPYPRRLGGGRTRVQDTLEALSADRGTAFDASTRETTVYIEDMALARAIAAGWSTNQRLGSLWDARRMSEDILHRWEHNILNLHIHHVISITEVERRERVEALLANFGQASIHSTLYTQLSEELGDAFVAIEYIDYSSAYIQVPDGSYPWGVVGDSPWSSTVAHILVRLQKPDGWTEGEFYEAAGKVSLILEPALPVWTTYSWYRPGLISTASGGLTAVGFYLDDPHNLNNEILRA